MAARAQRARQLVGKKILRCTRCVHCDRKKPFLFRELDENNSNRQVHTAVQQYRLHSTRFYVVMWHQILYFLQNLLIPLLLFTNKERSSSKRRMDRGIADETHMPPFKFECFGSAAQGGAPFVCFHYCSLPRLLATVAAILVYPVAGAYALLGAYREEEGRCTLPHPSLRAEGGCAPVLRLSWIGERGCTT